MRYGIRSVFRSSSSPLAARTSIVALAVILSACGGGESGAVATASAVPVVTAPTATPTPTLTPTATPTPAPTPTPSPAPTPTPTATSGTTGSRAAVILSEGDSQSVFWGGNHTGIYAAAHPLVTFQSAAVGGSRIRDGGNNLLKREASAVALKPGYITVLIGANDLADSNVYASAQDWLTALWSYVDDVKAKTGAKVAVGTVLPQCVANLTDNNARNNQRRVVANAAIRAAVGSHIDAVIDFAADPDIGPDSAACDKAWYIDGLHPTDGGGAPDYTGGQGRMARIYSAALDKLIK